MDRIDTMRLFTRIVELGSFTAAADDASIARANATYAMKSLERRLGTRLLARTTRHVSATPEGLAYYERCRSILADIDDADAQMGGADASPQGRLRVDLQPSLATMFIFPRLGEFCRRYPDIDLVLGTGDRLVDLVREGVDCVVRGGEARVPGLVARRLALLPNVTCASHAYLDQHGRPRTLDQFRRHVGVNYLSTATGRPMPFQFKVDGKLLDVTLKSAISVTTAEAYNACCLQGLGFIQTARARLTPHLRDGTLVEVLPALAPPPTPLWVMYPQQRHLAPRLRVFVDWVVEIFAAGQEGGVLQAS
jgi:LysR family transcriptional regulator for bpeEF and oprC